MTTTSRRAEQLRSLAQEVAGDLPLFEVGLLAQPLPLLVPNEAAP
ncbi:MAG: hypothetical protein QOE45_3291 [Frankiaceae bacterium]|nr:hypothetical protein [Frankiaceae bacterium]